MTELLLKFPLLLASRSQGRQNLLKSLGIPFEVIPTSFDEEKLKREEQHLSPRELALKLSKGKALGVEVQNCLVLAADQTGEFDSVLLGKTRNPEECLESLLRMRGREHWLHSGWVLAKDGRILAEGVDSVRLVLRDLPRSYLDQKIREWESWYSCGGYHFEGEGRLLFSEVGGSEDAIVGLPLQPFLNALFEQGLVVWAEKNPAETG